jgi:hypothetical protein
MIRRNDKGNGEQFRRRNLSIADENDGPSRIAKHAITLGQLPARKSVRMATKALGRLYSRPPLVSAVAFRSPFRGVAVPREDKGKTPA